MAIIIVKKRKVIIDKKQVQFLMKCTLWIDDKGYLTISADKNRKRIRFHRLLMKAVRGQIVDHKNRKKLDNRRTNLRNTNHSGNMRNSKHRSHNTSGYRGVYFCHQTKRWRAEIRVNGKGIKLGRFDKKIVAARTYDKAARKYHGKFASLNFPRKNETGCK